MLVGLAVILLANRDPKFVVRQASGEIFFASPVQHIWATEKSINFQAIHQSKKKGRNKKGQTQNGSALLKK